MSSKRVIVIAAVTVLSVVIAVMVAAKSGDGDGAGPANNPPGSTNQGVGGNADLQTCLRQASSSDANNEVIEQARQACHEQYD